MAGKKRSRKSAFQVEVQHIGVLPNWSDIETIEDPKYPVMLQDALRHYGYYQGVKTLKKSVINYLGKIETDTSVIKAFKKSLEWRSKPTACALAEMFMQGMPSSQRAADYIMENVLDAISHNVKDGVDQEVKAEITAKVPNLVLVSGKLERYINNPSIQDRITAKIDEHILHIEETWEDDVIAGKKVKVDVLTYLRTEAVPASMVSRIADHFAWELAELTESQVKDGDTDLAEAYKHLKKPHVKRITTFYKELITDLEMYKAEKKVARTPRKRKATDKNKAVAKMQHLKKDDKLKLVSVDPTKIIEASELWVYNTRTRKLGTYFADDGGALGIRGTTITGFDTSKSTQRTLRKPLQQLNDFKKAGKVKLRTFLKDIKSVEIALSGRVTKDVILLKVA